MFRGDTSTDSAESTLCACFIPVVRVFVCFLSLRLGVGVPVCACSCVCVSFCLSISFCFYLSVSFVPGHATPSQSCNIMSRCRCGQQGRATCEAQETLSGFVTLQPLDWDSQLRKPCTLQIEGPCVGKSHSKKTITCKVFRPTCISCCLSVSVSLCLSVPLSSCSCVRRQEILERHVPPLWEAPCAQQPPYHVHSITPALHLYVP